MNDAHAARSDTIIGGATPEIPDAADRDYATAYVRLDTTVSCIITRFRFKSVWSLLACLIHYRRIKASARKVPGFLASVLGIESRHTCYTISLWSHDEAILRFTTDSMAHIDAGNWLYGRMMTRGGKPELWSAKFKLDAVSEHNLRWDGFDVLDFIRAATPSRSTAAEAG